MPPADARLAQAARLRELLAALHWSPRQLATHLGAHITQMYQWAARGERARPGVLEWLEQVAAPLCTHPHPPEGWASGPSSDMTAVELISMRESLRWPRTVLARSIGVSVDVLRPLEQGVRPVPAPLAAWLREVSFPIRQQPQPKGWVRRVEILPPPAPYSRPIARVLPGMRVTEMVAKRRAAEAAAKAAAKVALKADRLRDLDKDRREFAKRAAAVRGKHAEFKRRFAAARALPTKEERQAGWQVVAEERRRWIDERREQAAQLRAKGLTTARIGLRLGVSRPAVELMLEKHASAGAKARAAPDNQHAA